MFRLEEASMNIATASLRAFLERIASLLSPSLGGSEIAQIVELAMRIPVDDEYEFQFPIEYAGQPTTVTVRVFKDDIEEVGLYFFAPSKLADVLQMEMEQYTQDTDRTILS